MVENKAKSALSTIGRPPSPAFSSLEIVSEISAPIAAAIESSENSPPHIPVLLDEVLAALAPRAGGYSKKSRESAALPLDGGVYCDGTFGAGGYSKALLDASPSLRLLALDRDPTAIQAGQKLVHAYAPRLMLHQTTFSEMQSAIAAHALPLLDGIVLDIGVSSMQLDQAARGFSFRNDGPLDMRMGGDGVSAADLVNEASENHLADIFYHYGEERMARTIARAIVQDRKTERFETTGQLARLIARLIKTRMGDHHPATRSFQALRIAVNDELNELSAALHAAEACLKPGGRLAVVTFHSLEDRIVKVFFNNRAGKGGGGSRHAPQASLAAPTFTIDGKWPVSAGAEELARNPRSRSAKLRMGVRTEVPARGLEESVVLLAELPETSKNVKRRAAPKDF